MTRWWTYQKERFPIFAHGLLILAFSSCAVSYSFLLRQSGDDSAPTHPALISYAVAFGVCFLMFLQLRIADEFKDAEEDARWRPYRPVPRGLVTLPELRRLFILAIILQTLMALSLDWRLLIPLLIAWTYLALMSVEFFCRHWLKSRPVIYLVSHMGIMPLVDFFATSCDWLPHDRGVPNGLAWFLAASFFNGIVIEIGRKLRQPEAEEEGVETYSALWGRSRAITLWLGSLLATFLCALMAARAIDFTIPVATTLLLTLLLTLSLSHSYLHRGLSGKALENLSALWTLALYLSLGLLPLWLR